MILIVRSKYAVINNNYNKNSNYNSNNTMKENDNKINNNHYILITITTGPSAMLWLSNYTLMHKKNISNIDNNNKYLIAIPNLSGFIIMLLLLLLILVFLLMMMINKYHYC